MGMTDAGRRLMLDLLIGAGGTTFANANAYLGVGDSTTAFAASQTDLVAATNKMREACDTGPTRATDTLTAVASFEAADANWAWEEVGLFNASSGGTMLSRKVGALGTKASPAVWTLTYTLQVTNT